MPTPPLKVTTLPKTSLTTGPKSHGADDSGASSVGASSVRSLVASKLPSSTSPASGVSSLDASPPPQQSPSPGSRPVRAPQALPAKTTTPAPIVTAVRTMVEHDPSPRSGTPAPGGWTSRDVSSATRGRSRTTRRVCFHTARTGGGHVEEGRPRRRPPHARRHADRRRSGGTPVRWRVARSGTTIPRGWVARELHPARGARGVRDPARASAPLVAGRGSSLCHPTRLAGRHARRPIRRRESSSARSHGEAGRRRCRRTRWRCVSRRPRRRR